MSIVYSIVSQSVTKTRQKLQVLSNNSYTGGSNVNFAFSSTNDGMVSTESIMVVSTEAHINEMTVAFSDEKNSEETIFKCTG